MSLQRTKVLRRINISRIEPEAATIRQSSRLDTQPHRQEALAHEQTVPEPANGQPPTYCRGAKRTTSRFSPRASKITFFPPSRDGANHYYIVLE